MKLVHSSDWHLGHSLFNYSRMEEFAVMVGQMVEIVRREQPDLFLLSGDVFDSSNPSTAAERFFTESMVAIHEAAPEMRIIITAGNHDSASAHEVFRAAWRIHNVDVVGRPPRPEDNVEEWIITLPGKGIVVAMPYANANFNYLSTAELLEYVAEHNPAGLPVVLMAHTSVSGSDWQGHRPRMERDECIIGNIAAAPLSSFGEGYDYCALGHIHRAQTLRGSGKRARYSGSPLPIGFDESGVHSVSVVTLAAHGDTPEIREIALETPVPLVTIPSGEGGEPAYGSWKEVLDALKEYHPEGTVYVRLNVEQEEMLPVDAEQRAREACAPGVRYCLTNYRPLRQGTEGDEASRELTLSEFADTTPLQIAERYFADKGVAFGEKELEMFNYAANRAAENKRDL